MFAQFLSVLLAIPLAFSSPIHARQSSNSTFVLQVTNFTAFMADPYIESTQSNLSFHIADLSSENPGAADCVVPPTYFNLYAISALYDYCGPSGAEFAYRFFETGLEVRRTWASSNGTVLTGTSTQQTSWTDGVNATTLVNGKMFVRKDVWEFPLGFGNPF